jgi:hypothetical protein
MRSDTKKLLNFWLGILCLGLLAATPAYLTKEGGTVGPDANTGIYGYIPGGALSLKAVFTDSYGSHCGAKGDNSTDDYTAIQSCIYYSNTHHTNIDVPPGNYIFKTGLWMCGTEANHNALCPSFVSSVILRGHSQWDTTLVPDLTSAGIAVDDGSAYLNGLEEIAVSDEYVTTDHSTIGFVSAEGGAGGGAPTNFLNHIFVDMQSSLAPGGAFGVMYCGTDLDWNNDVQVYSGNTSIIAGDYTGTAHGVVTSSYYTLDNSDGSCNGTGGMTHFSFGGNNQWTTYGGYPAAQLTGASDYNAVAQNYFTSDGTFASGSSGVVVFSGVLETAVSLLGIRTEYHGPNTYPSNTVSALWLNANAQISGGIITGILTTAQDGYLIGGVKGSVGEISNLIVKADDAGEAGLFNYSGNVIDSDLSLGFAPQSPTPVMGTLGWASGSRIMTGEPITPANMLAGITSQPITTTLCGAGPSCITTNLVGIGGPRGSGFPPAAWLDLANSGVEGMILPGQLPVGSLPSASANAGGLYVVTDATTASAQGQVCAAGGSTHAIAVSNGTNWNCYGYPQSAPAQVPIRAGTWTITNPASSTAVSFATPMTIAPDSCTISWSASVISVGVPWVSTFSAAGLTVNLVTTPTSTFSGSYFCGNNNAN